MKIIIRPKFEITDEILMMLTFGRDTVGGFTENDYRGAFDVMKSEEIEMEEICDEIFGIPEQYKVIPFRYPIDELEKYYIVEQI